MTVKNPAARLARWITRLEQYDFKIEYRKGSLHQNADALSRWTLEDKDEDGSNDNNDIIINKISFYSDNELIIIEPKSVKLGDSRIVELRVHVTQVRPIEEHDAQKADTDITWI